MPTAKEIAEARHRATHPHSVNLIPALMGDAWAVLKEARGQPVDFNQLREPHHLIGPATPAPEARRNNVVADLHAARAPHISSRIKAHVARITGGSFGGDAA